MPWQARSNDPTGFIWPVGQTFPTPTLRPLFAHLFNLRAELGGLRNDPSTAIYLCVLNYSKVYLAGFMSIRAR